MAIVDDQLFRVGSEKGQKMETIAYNMVRQFMVTLTGDLRWKQLCGGELKLELWDLVGCSHHEDSNADDTIIATLRALLEEATGELRWRLMGDETLIAEARIVRRTGALEGLTLD